MQSKIKIKMKILYNFLSIYSSTYIISTFAQIKYIYLELHQ